MRTEKGRGFQRRGAQKLKADDPATVVTLGSTNNDNRDPCQAVANVVKKPTRGKNCLDLIIMNRDFLYLEPIMQPSMGKSDHLTITWAPKSRSEIPVPAVTTTLRRLLPNSSIRSF